LGGRKIGALIVGPDYRIRSTGYNGPPVGIPHCGEERITKDSSLPFIPPDRRHECPRRALGFASGEGLEHCTAVHAEANAIANAARLGIPILHDSIYMNCGIPCRECLKLIINAGLDKIVCTNPEDYYDELSRFLVKESGIKIRKFYHLED